MYCRTNEQGCQSEQLGFPYDFDDIHKIYRFNEFRVFCDISYQFMLYDIVYW